MTNAQGAKLARARRLLSSFKRRLARVPSPSRSRLKLFVYPTDRAFDATQDSLFAESDELHAEDYANYGLVRWLLSRQYRPAATAKDADFVFLPIFLTAFIVRGYDLTRLVGALELPRREARALLFSSWDWVDRPTLPRANPRCRLADVIATRGAPPAYYRDNMSWIDHRFVMLSYESTIDLLPQDISSLPLVAARALHHPGGERPLLYAFVGTPTNEQLPSGHVRSAANKAIWDELGRGEDAFIGSFDEATLRFGAPFHYRHVYSRSRFVLCPAGFGRWSFRLTEAIACGAIPVILSDYYLKPFSRSLAWDDFSITVPESALADVGRMLRAVDPRRVAFYRRNLARAQAALSPEGLGRLLAAELQERA